jgi:alkylation response protein AidB-like acyl-CoA dehydrogenase
MIAELQDAARRALDDAGLAAGEEKTWPLLVELGWLLVAAPEELGGLEQGLPGACAIYGELGRSLAAAPYLPAMLAIDALAHSTLADRASWIERLTGGEYVAAPLAASSLTVANGRLNGVARAVQAADRASHVLVWRDDVVALAPLAGATRAQRTTWDETRRLFDVTFKDAALDEGLILARGADARALSARLNTHRDFALAAESVGAADALLDMTVEYLKTRKQYGRPLALFQALKHRCADLKMQTLAAEALLLDSLARDDGDSAVRAKMAKQLAAATFFTVAEEAVQLHGGIAMTAEHACHLFLKRALLNQHLGDGADRAELAIAAHLLDA